MNFLQKEEEKEEEDESMKKFEPFTYINEENLKRLIYLFLIRKEDPWVIAIVLSYLKPELARQALSMFPVEIQAKVALESLRVRQASKEQIEAIDNDIKNNVDFVMGGIEQLTKMLEDADAQTKKNIIEYLKTQKPDIYEKIKKVLLTFEDILSFADKDVQTIIRSVSSEDVARALKNADPQMQEKFFKNMSQGAVNTVKEIMEYAGDLNQQQIDEAQMKILDNIKALEAEGKISSYRRSDEGVYIVDIGDISADEERKKRFAKITKQENTGEKNINLEEYMQAAVNFFNQNDFNSALQYFEYIVGADPNNASAWQYLGSTYYSLNRMDDSVSAYEKYVELTNDQQTAAWLNDIKKQLGK
jgi:flagellar motor switch protein FliG